MNTQEKLQDLNNQLRNEIRTELTKVQFPFEKSTADNEDIKNFLTEILSKSSLETLKADVEVYSQLVDENYNLFSITFPLNTITKISANDLSISNLAYSRIVKLCQELGNIHNELAKPIQDKIQAKYQNLANKIQNQENIETQKQRKQSDKKVIPMNRN